MPKHEAFSQKHADNFVPLPYPSENHDLPVRPTGLAVLCASAMGRSYLDNFDHLTTC